MIQHLELLSPAGNRDAMLAAISAGADAVYFGASAFSARAGAGFDDEALKEAIRLLHLYQKKAYITVNTLIKPNELPGIDKLFERLLALKADAVIVQDLGVLRVLRQSFPELCVHASTQMSVHNAQGAEFLLSQGVSRVVLARECSLLEIQEIAKTGIEVEVFVHGALCVSVSGQCLFSSQIGGRSGNRGRCAQPCRLPYTYKDSQGALLSMRDLNTLEQIPALLDAGVTSLKIEGRLKRPEYVGIVTSAYRDAIDAIDAPKDQSFDFSKAQEDLQQIFSRGFTPGHAFGSEDAGLLRTTRAAHEGILLGKIIKLQARDGFFLAETLVDTDLHDGDSLQIRGTAKEQDILYSGPMVPAHQTAVLRLRTAAGVGDTAHRLADEHQLRQARENAQLLPRIPVDMHLLLSPGHPTSLSLSSRGVTVQVQGDTSDEAVNQPLTKENALPRLAKTGGTPFTLENLAFHSNTPAFLSAASLNDLRRKGLMALENALMDAHMHSASSSVKPSTRNLTTHPADARQSNTLYALVHPGFDREHFKRAGVERFIIAPFDFRAGKLTEQLGHCQPEDLLLLPRQIGTNALKHLFQQFTATGCQIMVDNIGQLPLPHQHSFYVYEGIPAWNKEALSFLEENGARGLVLSRELSQVEIQALSESPLELILPVYGRAAIMHLNHCPERLRLGMSSNRAACTLCDQGRGVMGAFLTDRKGCHYPLWPNHMPEGCVIGLYYHEALHLSDLAEKKMSHLIDLRLLAQDDAVAVIEHYSDLKKGKSPSDIGSVNPGRYLKGVM